MTQHISDLEALLRQWANTYATKAGTTINWIDLHGRHSAMSNYQKFKIKTEIVNIRYQGDASSSEMPGQIVEDTTLNNTSNPQKAIFKQSKETTSTFTWTLKETVKIGNDMKFFVSIPPTASTTINSTELSTEVTINKTQTEVQSWNIERYVTVAPQHKMEMTWTVKEQETSGTFYADVIFTGYVAFWIEDRIDINDPDGDIEYNLWFTPIVQAFEQMVEWGIQVPNQYIVGFNSIIFRITGECEGVAGYDTSFVLQETPLVASKIDLKYRRINAVSIPAY